MIKNVVCSIEIKTKRSLKSSKIIQAFIKKFDAFIEKETKEKVQSLQEIQKSSKPLKYGISYYIFSDHIIFNYLGNDNRTRLPMRDKMLNTMLSFVEVDLGIKKIEVRYAKTIQIQKVSAINFIDSGVLSKFNTNLKQNYAPLGIFLESNTLPNEKGKSLVMIMTSEKRHFVDITIERNISISDRWDILKSSDVIVNNLKKELLNNLKVKEK